MGEFIVHGRLLCSRPILSSVNIFSSSGVILDLACSIGSGRSFWTNWSWTNFPLSHQLPLCSNGRPGYCRDFNKILLFCEPCVVKRWLASRVDFVSPRNRHVSISE